LQNSKCRLITNLRREIKDQRVIDVIAQVPREKFIPDSQREFAYEDRALPIEFGQTISQPTIVAIMIDALQLRKRDKVLEIGTGSGYQAALLSGLVKDVITLERIPDLAESAKSRLASMGHHNVQVIMSDGSVGWCPNAPYDGVVVSAAAPRILGGLIKQVVSGGRLVMPVGQLDSQQLVKITVLDNTFAVETLIGCRFVPLVGDDAWSEEEELV
jgi:protein-L-isoaspartate(D-aspartate) O-methyltransferase